MNEDKHPGDGLGNKAYDDSYFMKKFGISETELKMALAEIHYGSPQELEDFIKLKYQKGNK